MCSSQTAETGWRRVFSGSIADVTAASAWVERIAASLKLPGKLTFAMQVCLEELMSNIARHGKVHSISTAVPTETDADSPLSISIDIDLLADRVVMTIEDNGRPFDVEKAPAKVVDRPLEQVQPGGLGINLIKSFSHNIEYRRTDAGNRVTVDFMR
ncbi:MAG TPA: ATP-binding protein [Methylocystis sp.]|jgi:anti-sigma regulatory factor (Ser/Thr protein kinase)